MNKILTGTLSGLSVNLISVEVDVASGLPGLTIVGLGDKAVNESKERVRSAIKHSDLQFPQSKVTINLSPADLKKEGSGFDLSIAVAILQGSGQISVDERKFVFFGELALDGAVKSVKGIIPLIINIMKVNPEIIFVIPREQLNEAQFVTNAQMLAVKDLKELVYVLREELPMKLAKTSSIELPKEKNQIDFSMISGQLTAKRVLEIAAAGGHHVILAGPPGAGKTLLAKAFPGILPDLTSSEALEVNCIYSASGLLSPKKPILNSRPFRSPHHTASAVALVGGGSEPRPGEVTLAHRGVLFLDELPEFPRAVLEAMREPLEDKSITVSRVAGSQVYPAAFQLIATANSCPCGNLGSQKKMCTCSSSEVARYQKKASGALLDRIDIRLSVTVPDERVFATGSGESSDVIKERVQAAVKFRELRSQFKSNSELNIDELKSICEVTADAENILDKAVKGFELSMRSAHKIVRVARTIADLFSSKKIEASHVAEALQYRDSRLREYATSGVLTSSSL